VDAESPPDPRIGNVLQGRYRIISKLASGAMGVVYKGERLELGRAVAVKFLHPWIAAQKAFLDRFGNEAKAMSRMLHPNCVSVMDFGVDGSPYLVMDFVTGKTLRDILEDGPLAPARALRIAQQLLAGLAYAHAQGIVHRDLKPENLILSDEPGLEEHLRILDFGLAKLRDGPAMTAGLAVGTPSYMSPEQSGADGEIDARTDLYTVGVLLFELLTGAKPFVSSNVGEIILMHREAPPPHLRKAAPQARFSLELELLLLKAMSKKQTDRFQSAVEMAAALEATPEARGEKPAFRPPPGRPPDATTVDTISAVRRRIEASKAAPEAAAGSARQWRVVWFGGGFLLVALLALLVGRGLRPNRSPEVATGHPVPAAPPARPPAPGAPPAPAASDPARLEEARGLIARGEIDQAIAVLNRLRADHPDDAEAPYLLAMTYFDHRRWADGLAAAQIAVQKNPTLKSDPDLIKGAIASLASDRGYERSQAFLRSLGAAATPFVKTAARHDTNPRVRDRAEELLDGGGRGWSGHSSSSSGMFRR
jgi:tetratricopeptide (TPR) repeat protein